MNCIICEFSVSEKDIIDSFKVKELRDVYRKSIGIDVLKEVEDEALVSVVRCSYCDGVHFSPVMSGDEKFYEDISKNDWYYPVEKFEFDYAAGFINKNQLSVLEVGAGRGSFAKKLNKNIRYVGLEFNDNAVSMAQKENISIYKKTMQDFLKESSERFNAVLSFQVLEHVTSPNHFLKEKLELVNPGGYLIIAVPSADSFYKKVTNHTLDLPPHHLSRWSDACLAKLTDIFNLDLIEIKHEPLQEIHYAFFITEKLKMFLIPGFKYVRVGLFYRCVSKFSTIAARLLVPLLKEYLGKQQGAHVVAVYRKKHL